MSKKSSRKKRRANQLRNLSPVPCMAPKLPDGVDAMIRANANSLAAFVESHLDGLPALNDDTVDALQYAAEQMASMVGHPRRQPLITVGDSLGSFNLAELGFETRHLNNGRRQAVITNLKYKEIPPLVTPDTIGDAVAYMDRDRVFGCGWWVFQAAGRERQWWTRTRPDVEIAGFHPVSGRLLVARRPHPLGVSYDMDDCAGLHARNCYSGPHSAGHRARVIAYGGGAAYVADDCEGWDAVYALGNREDSTLHLASWRGSQRVWILCGSAYELTRRVRPLRCYEWSGGMAFDGEVYRTWWKEVLPGNMPPRVFVEWLCENYRLPVCMVRHLRYAGFEPCRN